MIIFLFETCRITNKTNNVPVKYFFLYYVYCIKWSLTILYILNCFILLIRSNRVNKTRQIIMRVLWENTCSKIKKKKDYTY